MVKAGAEPIANRDTPIPVVSITGPDEHSADRTPSNHDGPRHHLSASKLKDKLESLGDSIGKTDSPSRVSDRMLTMYDFLPFLISLFNHIKNTIVQFRYQTFTLTYAITGFSNRFFRHKNIPTTQHRSLRTVALANMSIGPPSASQPCLLTSAASTPVSALPLSSRTDSSVYSHGANRLKPSHSSPPTLSYA